MQVTVDNHSGFCFGVVYAIEVAERELLENHILYCLGDIVHNGAEVERLTGMGLVIITHEQFRNMRDCKVMIRAHGEPPETYETAIRNRIELIDASCPIVLTLQNAIYRGFREMAPLNGQVVIYGKVGHAEVNALIGQTAGTAIVIEGGEDLGKLDFSRPIRFYSQTTKGTEGFNNLVTLIWESMKSVAGENPVDFEWNDSICRNVSGRADILKEFVARHDVVVFVSGLKSSNGQVLFRVCREINPNTYLVSGIEDLDMAWFEHADTVGVCGATSTPAWLMESIAAEIRKPGN